MHHPSAPGVVDEKPFQSIDAGHVIHKHRLQMLQGQPIGVCSFEFEHKTVDDMRDLGDRSLYLLGDGAREVGVRELALCNLLGVRTNDEPSARRD